MFVTIAMPETDAAPATACKIATGTWKATKFSTPKAERATVLTLPQITAKKNSGMKMFPTSTPGCRSDSRIVRIVG